MNVCDIQSRVARVTCGDLNEVNNLLHLFHLPSSCYCAHIHSMRAISHHRPVIRCFTYMNFPQFHVVRDDYICGGRGAEVSFCGIRGMQHRGDFTLVMQKPDIFVSTLQSGDNLKKKNSIPYLFPKGFCSAFKSEYQWNPAESSSFYCNLNPKTRWHKLTSYYDRAFCVNKHCSSHLSVM